ncbi:hypothetical protein SFRURICE_017381 [Spodoptera frugiperda]|nr:hypothetical protein SFRURICE_017381 [Spodoptera frugiperda]
MITHENLAISLPYIWKTMSKFPSPIKISFVVAPAQWITTGFNYIFSPVLKFTRLQTSKPVTPEHFGDLPNYILCNPVLMRTLAEQANCDFTCFEQMSLAGSYKLTQSEDVFIHYGMSELSGTAFVHDCPAPPGSCGRPAGSFDCKLVDPETHKEVTEPHVQGELWFKGPAVFKGYHNNPEVTRETFSDDGWFRCGDIFYRDESWNVYFVERYKSLLKYNNHQVSPLEVEMVIMKHPGVFQVAVTGIPDRECGDLVVACVVPKPGCSPTAQEIRDLVTVLMRTLAERANCDFTCFEQMSLAGSYKLTQSEDVFIHYGMSELSGTAFVHDCPAPPGSCGRPAGSFDCKLVDPETHKEVTEPHVQGELWFKGPAVFKVSPLEVEMVILKNPGVLQVAVTGIPDRECGDLVVACVVPKAGCSPTAQEIKDLVKENLTDTKHLRGGVIFMKSLPITSASKINRQKLKELALTMPRE